MTTLYRSPTVIIDAHEWHVVVLLGKSGRVSQHYRWRPVAIRASCWSNITSWKGPKPKGLFRRLSRFRIHVQFAMGTEVRRKAAAATLGQKPIRTAAMIENMGIAA